MHAKFFEGVCKVMATPTATHHQNVTKQSQLKTSWFIPQILVFVRLQRWWNRQRIETVLVQNVTEFRPLHRSNHTSSTSRVHRQVLPRDDATAATGVWFIDGTYRFWYGRLSVCIWWVVHGWIIRAAYWWLHIDLVVDTYAKQQNPYLFPKVSWWTLTNIFFPATNSRMTILPESDPTSWGGIWWEIKNVIHMGNQHEEQPEKQHESRKNSKQFTGSTKKLRTQKQKISPIQCNPAKLPSAESRTNSGRSQRCPVSTQKWLFLTHPVGAIPRFCPWQPPLPVILGRRSYHTPRGWWQLASAGRGSRGAAWWAKLLYLMRYSNQSWYSSYPKC